MANTVNIVQVARFDTIDTNIAALNDLSVADIEAETDPIGVLIVALNNLSTDQVNTEVDNALNTAIPGSPTADSINEVLRNAGLGALALPASIYPSDDLIHSNDIEISGITDDTYTRKKEIVCAVNGVIRVKFDHQQFSGAGVTSKIYKNRVGFGTEHGEGGTGYVTETEDLLFEAGDTIELWTKRTIETGSVSLRNFRLYGIVVTEFTNSLTG